MSAEFNEQDRNLIRQLRAMYNSLVRQGAITIVSGAVEFDGSATVSSVAVTSLPALPTGSNTIGTVGVTGTVTVGAHNVFLFDSAANALTSTTGDPGLTDRGFLVKQGYVRGKMYVGSALASAVGVSKNHLSVYNADSTLKVELVKAYLTREITAAVTGLIRGYRLFRFTTAHTLGTTPTVRSFDTGGYADLATLTSNVTVRAASTIGGAEAQALCAVGVYEEETGGGVNQYSLFDEKDFGQPIILNQNEGLTIQQDATAGTGLVSAFLVFRVR